MDFSFDEDPLALRDSVSRLLMTEAAPEFLREIWETDGGRSPQLRAKMAEQGLTALSVPESLGGMGLGDADWALMTQELGYYAIPDSLADTAYVAVGALCTLGLDHPCSQTWLPKIADGSARVALSHPINPWVADAQGAHLLLAARPEGTGLALHALPHDAFATAQPAPHRLNSIDASRRLTAQAGPLEQALQHACGPDTCLLSAEQAAPLWAELLNRAALNTAGQLIGLAQRMLDLSVDYASQRKQFGRAIGSFQAVKHHLADVVTQIEFAKPVLYRAALALQEGHPQASVFAAHAKLSASTAAWAASRKGIQVHGAMGYTWEVDLQMFMKRAWTLSAAWGDETHHRAQLAQAVLDDDAPLLGPAASLRGFEAQMPNT